MPCSFFSANCRKVSATVSSPILCLVSRDSSHSSGQMRPKKFFNCFWYELNDLFFNFVFLHKMTILVLKMFKDIMIHMIYGFYLILNFISEKIRPLMLKYTKKCLICETIMICKVRTYKCNFVWYFLKKFGRGEFHCVYFLTNVFECHVLYLFGIVRLYRIKL